ncbi:MAG: hypothetical protein V4438_00365 [Patescibacteria group bacterium]
MDQDNQAPLQQGSWTGIIIVILIIAIGGAYFWYVKSGAMQQLDQRNKSLKNQGASPAELFTEWNATGNADVSRDVNSIDAALK